ncbi:2-amino-4-hydroxy-6-hydroxymethyldihydropteridine diphosphokinase [Brevibacillus dissolubilis]|uniref:2-amino-4-hydroxy-6- hydroxymethyldihydropteridine diphosphokinase n=1 Tax=Brevibacillus dissolubilis TaxID=1844116 RepID=UPI0011166AF1|nr:2-amino-4-hydroxy-6-hydroxymethyldihydropteridine diphosphokinase [Brevibacillus dissolubilis]
MSRRVQAYLALGTNIGDRELNLQAAVDEIHHTEGITVQQLSAVYETDPVGYTDQPAFFNMVIRVETTLEPQALLTQLLSIEQELGRVRTVRWGPRTIDIDILLYGTERVELPELTIPHQAMFSRAFVLVPLRDVWEGGQLAGTTRTIDEWIALTEDHKGVHKWGTLDWEAESEPSAN